MSFNLDDPLAGILSDGSDDSFFDDDILGKKKPVKKKSTPIVEKKSTLFNLDNDVNKANTGDYGPIDKIKLNMKTSTDQPFVKSGNSEMLIKSESKQTNSLSSFKNLANNESKQTEPKSLTLADKTDITRSPFKSRVGASNDKIDILDDIVGPKNQHVKSLEKGKGSQSILDDILGKPSIKNKPDNQASKKQQYNFDSITRKNESKEVLLSKKNQSETNQIESGQKKKLNSSEDWLGIFQDKSDNEKILIEDDKNDMPSWLGGNNLKNKTLEKENKTQTQTETVNLQNKPSINKTEVETKEIVESEKQKELKPIERLEEKINAVSDALENKESEDVTMQGAALYLQQQEAQLMVALQLKAQDEKLAAMQLKQKETQRVQREATLAQHAQLDAMLQRQANHRLQMQAIINAHQDRIAQRIKALLGSNNTEQDDVNDDLTYGSENILKENIENPRMKEKKQLLQLIQSLQENHNKEIDLMETSYRRQLAFLEISLNQIEERMKEESEKVVKFYMEKINWLEEHHQLYKKWMEENATSLTERHNVEKEMLRQQYLENVKALQEQQTALFENIKNAVKQEQILIRDAAGFSTDIQELMVDMKDNKSKCQLLVEKVEMLTTNTQDETQRSLQARETQINEMIQQLKKEREYFEKEKSETKETIHTLEVRLKQMTAIIEEESASLKQKKMEFEFEKATFSKQTEFAKNVLKKQDEEVKMLKEEMQKQYEEKYSQINEEKAKTLKDAAIVAKEKASIQSLKMELEKTKVELNAQLEEMSEERSKLNLQKQELHTEEQRILAKGRDLEMLTKTAMEKQSQAEKKYAEAESQQRKYEERIRRIQEHVVSLNAREKEIAREKIALSRERISLHNDWKQIESRQQCSLCRSTPKTPQFNLEATYRPQVSYDMPVSRDYGEGNVSHALNEIEQEMAHLMGRTFGLRHDNALASIHSHGEKYKDIEHEGEHLEDIPNESAGSFKDYLDPKFMMLRLDVQKVINNLDVKESAIDKK